MGRGHKLEAACELEAAQGHANARARLPPTKHRMVQSNGTPAHLNVATTSSSSPSPSTSPNTGVCTAHREGGRDGRRHDAGLSRRGRPAALRDVLLTLGRQAGWSAAQLLCHVRKYISRARQARLASQLLTVWIWDCRCVSHTSLPSLVKACGVGRCIRGQRPHVGNSAAGAL